MRVLLVAFIVLLSQALFGQDLSISGIVVDAKDKSSVPGANVTLLHPWGEVFRGVVTDDDGKFLIDKLSNGGYRMKISYVGFPDFEKEVTLSGTSIDLGTLELAEGGVQLDAVEITEKLPLATQDGDTTSYNADAFKTLKDASAEDLVTKMPGVTMQNGSVSAQGEQVQEVLVDGKRFFGNDPKAALRALPAEVISKIQVFDQKSEQSQFSGVDDGQTTKTINIITKPGMNNGQFGKFYAGAGTDGRYQAGGNTSLFDGDRRISIIGQSNNVNQQNFATEDLLGVVGSGGSRGRRGGRGGWGNSGLNSFLVDQQGGIAQTHAFGINYSDEWGEKFKITGSYFLNIADNVAEESSNTQFIDDRSAGEVYEENYLSNTKNVNHRANFRMTYELSERTSFIIRPSLSIQQNDGNSTTLGNTTLESTLLNQTDLNYRSDLSGTNFRNSILFRHRFPKRGRTFSVNLSTTYNDNFGGSYLQSTNEFRRDMIMVDTTDQFTDLMTQGWNYSTSVDYTEPLTESTSMSLSYRLNWQDDKSDRETLDRTTETGEYDQLNPTLSNVFENDYITHRAGLGFNIRSGRKLFALIRGNMQFSTLRSDETFPNPQFLERDFVNFVPFAMLRWTINEQRNLRLFYRSNTNSPSVTQLQNVVDNSNPLQLRVGNPALDQSVSHRLFLRYTSSNIEKASVFFILFSGSLTNDYIGNATYLSRSDNPIFDEYEIERGTQLTRPINMDGYRNARIYTTYGFPLGALKTNVNLDVSLNYTRIPGMIDDIENFSNNRSVTTGVTFASNISEKVDFTIGTRVGYNNVNNTIRDELNDIYWTQSSNAKLGVVFPAGIVLRTDITHQLYRGLADEFNTDFFLWNVGIGKKLFKNELGEITLSVFDILKQNQSISRNITETFIEDQRVNVLQQYLMLTFTYNFRNFKTKKPSAPSSEEQRDRRPWH